MANLEPMPISSLPEGDIQDGDKAIIYRESTGKAYQTTGLAELSADLTYKTYDSLSAISSSLSSSSTLSEVMSAMPNRSILICQGTEMDMSDMSNGSIINIVTIIRHSGARIFAIGARAYSGVTDAQSRLFFATFDQTNTHGWFELAKTDASTTSALNAEAEEISED